MDVSWGFDSEDGMLVEAPAEPKAPAGAKLPPGTCAGGAGRVDVEETDDEDDALKAAVEGVVGAGAVWQRREFD